MFFYDKAGNEVFEVPILEDDIIKVPNEYLFFRVKQHKGLFSVLYDSITIIEAMEENLGDITYYKELLKGHELKEDDNPVILVGRVI
ncbi:MAG: hypothetical protein ACFHWX_18135 [Bacteroidota bacterium]